MSAETVEDTEASAATCPSCRAQVSTDARFCPGCGQAIMAAPPVDLAPPASPRSNTRLYVLLGILAALIGIPAVAIGVAAAAGKLHESAAGRGAPGPVSATVVQGSCGYGYCLFVLNFVNSGRSPEDVDALQTVGVDEQGRTYDVEAADGSVTSGVLNPGGNLPVSVDIPVADSVRLVSLNWTDGSGHVVRLPLAAALAAGAAAANPSLAPSAPAGD